MSKHVRTRVAVPSSLGPGLSGLSKAVMIAWSIGAGLTATPALAGPTGAHVARGNVTITQNGNRTIIRASDGSIINYLNFNIGAGETVRFIQPNQLARVLNRINGAEPTLIQGSLLANGRVYIVNPAGVMFGSGAVVNVGGLYAAAGNITDTNFINGVDKFTGLNGPVSNNGSISADAVHLLGENVFNDGTITADHGLVTMVAGNEVTLIPNGERITVRVDGQRLTNRSTPLPGHTTPDMTANPGVENTGTINARRGEIVLGAGDLYSLAIRNTGQITAAHGDITLSAADGLVQNAQGGVISADALTGRGGSVTVQGPSVLNAGRISANSADGHAGEVEVTSQNHTYLTDTSRVSASGTTGNADGGEVLVHSYNGTTAVADGAKVDISGGALGGDGGFAEISGANLMFNGYVDTRCRPGYTAGEILFDPLHIVINATGGDEGFLNGNIIEFNEPNMTDSLFISAAALALLTGKITLEAYGTIWVQNQIDLVNNNDLCFRAADDITIAARITGANNLDFHADFDNSGAGRINIGAPLAITGDSVMRGVSINLIGGTLESDGNQDYMDPVLLCVDTTLRGDRIQFHDTVDDLFAGQQFLVVVPTDVVQFDEAVGGGARLEYLRVNGHSQIDGGLVVTDGFQKYNGPTDLGAHTTMISTNSGDVRFNGTLDGSRDLSVFTAGQTVFGGEVGGENPLQDILTDEPGTVQINADLTAHSMTFEDPAALGADVTATGEDLVKFGSSLDGHGHDLTVDAIKTEFHGDATDLGVLETIAGGTTLLALDEPEGTQAAPQHKNQLDIVAEQVIFGDHVRVGSDAYVTGYDGVDFDRTLVGGFDVTTDSDVQVRFGGDVGRRPDGDGGFDNDSLASLTTHVAPAGVVDENLVIINGNYMRAVGDIRFNPDGRDRPAEVATVAAKNFGGLVIQSDEGDIFMGFNEKMTSLGDLTLNAREGSVTVGDLNALGDVTLDTPHVAVYARESGNILNSEGDLVPDNQASYVAFGTYTQKNPNMTAEIIGDGPTPVFAQRVSDLLPPRLREFLSAVFAELEARNFVFGEKVLDLAPPLRTPTTLVLAGPTQVNDRIYLDPFAIRDAGNLAINMREGGVQELSESVAGRELYLDYDTQPGLTPGTRAITTHRLRREAIVTALDDYNKVYFVQETDENGNVISSKDNIANVRQVLATSWSAYAAQAGPETSSEGYRAWLDANKEEQAEALAYVTTLRDMCMNVKALGLSPSEQEVSLKKVTAPLVSPAPVIVQPHLDEILGLAQPLEAVPAA